MSHTMQHANILNWARDYDGEPFHALLCDPPYHLTEIVKRFGKSDSAPAQYGTDGAFQRASKGFMGKQWDGGDVAFRAETWAALAKHLYPGAFGMAFASSRGWHRMAVAIEDAGLIIHPVIMCWSYGSGFPKATRIDTQVDRKAGVVRTKVGTRKHQPKFAAAELGYREKDNGYNSKARTSFDVTAAATDLAAAWEGYRYGMQALKPALEPVIVFQRPYAGRPVDTITATGAGALNIEGGRIGRAAGDRWEYGVDGDERGCANQVYGALDAAPYSPHDAGRWPSNLILQHTPDCNGACHPSCPVVRLGEQSGEGESKASTRGRVKIFSDEMKGAIGWEGESTKRGHTDVGTAARFFYQVDWLYERLEAADPVAYFAKASRAEREAGLEPRAIALMRDLDDTDFEETTVDDGRKTPIDNPYLRGETIRRNTHPTIKPISLARYLSMLLLPPDRYAPRRLLIPFAGAGSEMIGAMLAGWEVVTGVELEANHVAIAEARLAYWHQRRHEFGDPSKPITVKAAQVAPNGQLDMFDA